MALATGSFLAFDAPRGVNKPINLVLTPDGTDAVTVAGAYNVEVFTSVAGAMGLGFDASAFVQGAVSVLGPDQLTALPNEVRAGSLTSIEQLLQGTVRMTDVWPGGETLVGGAATIKQTIVGGAGANQTLVGAANDTLMGNNFSPGGSGEVLDALAGNELVILPLVSTNFAVYGAAGDTIIPIFADPSAASGTSGQIVGSAGLMAITTNVEGNYTVASGTGDTIRAGAFSLGVHYRSGGSNHDIIGASRDLIDLRDSGGSDTVVATAGSETVIGGGGYYNYSTFPAGNLVVYGAADDSISADYRASAYIDASAGHMTITTGAYGPDIIVGGVGDTIAAPSGSLYQAAVNIQSLGAGALVDLSNTSSGTGGLFGNTGALSINASAGADTVIAGGGDYSIYGGIGDSITGGAGGAGQIVGSAGSMAIVLGKAGTATIASGVGDTITALAGNANASIAGAAGDTIDLTGNFGADTIDARAGNEKVTLGTGAQALVYGGTADTVIGTSASTLTVVSGPNSLVTAGFGSTTVYGAAGDTITAGPTGTSYVDGTAGAMRIQLGADGTDVIFGSTTSGAGTGDTITGTGAALLNYSPGSTVGGAGDLLDLSRSSGAATVNAFSSGAANIQLVSVNDTIMAGSGSTSVWGGAGDRIGVGSTSTAGGSQLFDHSTTVAGAVVLFGTFDSAAASSTAQATVTNFDTKGDGIFYQNEAAATTAAIVAAQTHSGGNTVIVLPDGTTMTFVGIATITAGMFKL